MFEKFLSADVNDFRQRYAGTYGFFRNENNPLMLAKITDVGRAVMFVDKKNQTYEVFPDRPTNIGFLFLPPRSGWVNSQDAAYYTERVAQRQFSRGVCDRNTRIYKLTDKFSFQQQAINFNILEKVYEPTITPVEAWKNFISGKSPSYAPSAQFGMDKTNIYIFAAHCGKVEKLSDKEVVFKLDEPDLWRTEILDAFRAIEIKAEVQ